MTSKDLLEIGSLPIGLAYGLVLKWDIKNDQISS
jgi:predicted homoserine dehydrogenase-like protein